MESYPALARPLANPPLPPSPPSLLVPIPVDHLVVKMQMPNISNCSWRKMNLGLELWALQLWARRPPLGRVIPSLEVWTITVTSSQEDGYLCTLLPDYILHISYEIESYILQPTLKNILTSWAFMEQFCYWKLMDGWASRKPAHSWPGSIWEMFPNHEQMKHYFMV